MAELPNVARSEILDSMQERKQNSHNSLIWAPIKMNEYPLERYFYKIFNGTIFLYMFCYVQGKIHEKEAAVT
jgi:hypothetical protein